MEIQYYCKNPKRLQTVKTHSTFNAIEYLEVLSDLSPVIDLKQRILLVHCVKAVTGITDANVIIAGGVRRAVNVLKAVTAANTSAIPISLTSAILDNDDPAKVLIVETDSTGDFSTYTLKLVKSATGDDPPDNFDPVLSRIEFSFKVECPSDFDCQPAQKNEITKFEQPRIDYLAKDYASFRRLLLDRLSAVMPDWKERNIADTGIALVEALAYAGDYLSYYQDAVANEAYLGTARQRTSVRRHARLVDYRMHDGCNARVWVQLQSGSGDIYLAERTQLMTRIAGFGTRIIPDSDGYDKILSKQPKVFETMHRIIICPAHNEIRFYTWGNGDCCLPKGATRATLQDNAGTRLRLRKGDVLIFEETRSSETGLESEKDPRKRHAVRLTGVYPEAEMVEIGGVLQIKLKEKYGAPQNLTDTLTGQPIVEIEWAEEDALPFAFCLEEVADLSEQVKSKHPVTVVRGNIVLVEHGRTLTVKQDDKAGVFNKFPRSDGRYRMALKQTEITQSVAYKDTLARKLPASGILEQDPREAIARITLRDEYNNNWFAVPDLLESGEFAREFVAEINPDVQALLRFGDGILGRIPGEDTEFSAVYLVGNGRTGNVGADSIFHIVTADDGIIGVRNPLPASGGTDAESMEEVRLYAPQAFRTQKRAVTADDYAVVAMLHTDVQKAVATVRWTGSWHTMFITVDRKHGYDVDDAFKADLAAFINQFRLAGHDIEIEPPVYVPLDIIITVCVKDGYFNGKVEEALTAAFSNSDLPEDKTGFFHPDNFTFGQPLYLSRVIDTAMQIPGVKWVDLSDDSDRFQRREEPPHNELAEGAIKMGRLEIIRLDNDPNAPENGRIKFIMKGGL
jgi:hypothetical protein